MTLLRPTFTPTVEAESSTPVNRDTPSILRQAVLVKWRGDGIGLAAVGGTLVALIRHRRSMCLIAIPEMKVAFHC